MFTKIYYGFYVYNNNNEVGDGPFETIEEAIKSREANFKGQNVGYGFSSDKGFFSEVKHEKL